MMVAKHPAGGSHSGMTWPMSICRAAVAGAMFAGLMFLAGLVLGTARTLLLEPQVGSLPAVLLELPFMLAWSWFASRYTSSKLAVGPANLARLAMGSTALFLLLLAEAALSVTLGGLSLAQHIGLYRTVPVQLGFAAQALSSLFPILQLRLKT